MKDTIPEKVGNCNVCFPIKALLKDLVHSGFEIKDQKCSDYHFHEIKFILRGDKTKIKIEEIRNIDKICIHENGKFYCECHWSTVELRNE